MEDEKLYTEDQVMKMVRERHADLMAGEALFTVALGEWFVTMLDDSPELPLTCAKRVELMLNDVLNENKSPHTHREHARRLAVGLKVDVARRSRS